MPARDKEATSRSDVDAGLVKAIGHPLRAQLLSRLNERVASPVELARELDESVQLVSYHVRILRDLGFVELVRTTPRRGAIEHHYRAIRKPFFSDQDFASLPANARGTISGGILEDLIQHVLHAHANGVFEKVDNFNLTTANFVLDDEAFDALSKKVAEVYELANDLQAEAMPRIQAGNESVTARLAVMFYPAAEGSPAQTATRENSAKRRKKS